MYQLLLSALLAMLPASSFWGDEINNVSFSYSISPESSVIEFMNFTFYDSDSILEYITNIDSVKLAVQKEDSWSSKYILHYLDVFKEMKLDTSLSYRSICFVTNSFENGILDSIGNISISYANIKYNFSRKELITIMTRKKVPSKKPYKYSFEIDCFPVPKKYVGPIYIDLDMYLNTKIENSDIFTVKISIESE